MIRFLIFLYLLVFNFWFLLCLRILSFDWFMDAIFLVELLFDVRVVIIFLFYGFIVILGFRCFFGCICFVLSIEGFVEGEKINKSFLFVMNSKEMFLKNGKKLLKCTNGLFVYKNNNLLMRIFNYKSFVRVVFIVFGILILFFLLVSNLFFYVGFVVVERILYIFSLGYCLLIVVGVDVIWCVCN